MSRRKSKNKPLPKASVMGNLTTRNPVAANPLLGKSGAHGKTRKAERRAEKVSLSKLPLEQIACLCCVCFEYMGQALGSSGSLQTTCKPISLSAQ